MARSPWLDPARVDDVYWGAANQAGEDNRNVARMGVLLAGLPVEIPGATVNRLCGSGMEAIAGAARAIAAGDADICLAGGTESMTRAPFVLPRAEGPFPRDARGGRHPARLAAGEPADAAALPADHPRRDGRERGRALRGGPGPAGPVRAAQPSAGRPGRRVRDAGRGDHPGDRPGRPGDGRRGDQAGPDPGRPGREEARVPPGRHGHRGQFLAAERRRGRAAADVGAGGGVRRDRADCPVRRHRRGRGAPRLHGDRPGARDDPGCWPGPAGGRTTSTSSRSTRPSRPRPSRSSTSSSSTRDWST